MGIGNQFRRYGVVELRSLASRSRKTNAQHENCGGSLTPEHLPLVTCVVFVENLDIIFTKRFFQAFAFAACDSTLILGSKNVSMPGASILWRQSKSTGSKHVEMTVVEYHIFLVVYAFFGCVESHESLEPLGLWYMATWKCEPGRARP